MILALVVLLVTCGWLAAHGRKAAERADAAELARARWVRYLSHLHYCRTCAALPVPDNCAAGLTLMEEAWRADDALIAARRGFV